jgi:hypothetical protein
MLSTDEVRADVESGAIDTVVAFTDMQGRLLGKRNYARAEQRLFDEVVTCYERDRLFERG